MPESERSFAEMPMAQESPKSAERGAAEQPRSLEQHKPKAKETPVRPQLAGTAPAVTHAAPSHKSEALRRIETVMEDGLGEVYKTMPAEAKQQFKVEGEKTAAEIETLLYKVKVQSKKIFKLVLEWLRIIPGVNKYFIEQEAKLKTDEIIKIKEEMEKKTSEQRVW